MSECDQFMKEFAKLRDKHKSNDLVTMTSIKHIDVNTGKESLSFANSHSALVEKIFLEWDKFKEEAIVKEMPTHLLRENKHVQDLIEALEKALHNGTLMENWQEPNWVEHCDEVLKRFREGE